MLSPLTPSPQPPPPAPWPYQKICFTPQQITKQTLASNTYQICCPHRIVNLCSDESHPKEKKKYRHETWNIKLPMDLHITYLLYCVCVCVCVLCVCACVHACVCMRAPNFKEYEIQTSTEVLTVSLVRTVWKLWKVLSNQKTFRLMILMQHLQLSENTDRQLVPVLLNLAPIGSMME